MIGDLTREEIRARANAGLGAGVGLAFGAAFLFGPIISIFSGLSGIFGLATLLGVNQPCSPFYSSNTPSTAISFRNSRHYQTPQNTFVANHQSWSISQPTWH